LSVGERLRSTARYSALHAFDKHVFPGPFNWI
jgi:hypothetical protein